MKLGTARRTRVAISVPSPSYVHIEFVQSLIKTLFHCWGKIDIAVNHAVGSLIPQNRNTLVRMATEAKATHMLFIDADMVFPTDALPRLLAHNKDIVCATYSKRDGDLRPMGKLASGETAAVKRGGLVEFSLVGFGFMLIKMEVYTKLAMPYFAEIAVGNCEQPDGEDIYFCKRVREAGYQIWCDVGLSEQMGHIGTTVFYMKTDTPASS